VSQTVRRALWVLYGFLIAASAAITLWPEPTPVPLVTLQGWERDPKVFTEYLPSDVEISATIRNSPQSAFYQSYAPGIGLTTGDLATKSFSPPEYLSVPVRGRSALKSGSNRVTLECSDSRASLKLFASDTFAGTAESILPVPEKFCDRGVRLVARGGGSALIGTGTPASVSLLTFLKSKGIGMLFPHAFLFGLVSLYFLAGATLPRLLVDTAHGFLFSAVLLGMTGYAEFFAYYASPDLGVASTLLLFLAALSIIAFAAWFRRPALTGTWRQLDPFLTVWFLGSLAYTAILYSIDNGGGAALANYRFSPAAWSSDNQLMGITAEALGSGQPMQDLFGAGSGWQVSDRPPLLAGLVVFMRPFIYLLARSDDGPHFVTRYYGVLEIIYVGFWLPAVWYCLGTVRSLSWRMRCAIVLFVAITPFAIFNSIYTWPKLLGGAFSLLGCFVYLYSWEDGRTAEASGREPMTALCYLACFTALSLLSHGADFLFLGCFWAFVVLWRGGRGALLHLAWGVAIIAVLMAPWLAWQKLVDPPGNALVKSAFANTFGFEEKNVGVIETVIRAYAALTPAAWFDEKIRHFLLMLGAVSANFIDRMGDAGYNVAMNLAQKLRTRDFYFVGQSFAGAVICLALGAIGSKRRAAPIGPAAKQDISVCRTLVMLAVGSYLASVLVFRPVPIIHQLPYAAHLALLIGAAVWLAIRNRRAFYGVLAVEAAYSLIVWIVEPLFEAIYVDLLMVALSLAILAVGVSTITTRSPKAKIHVWAPAI